MSSPRDLLPAVQRLTLHLDHRLDSGRLFVRTDIRNRFEASPDSLELALPEAWIELYFNNSDLRIGRQILLPGISLLQSPVDRMQPVDLRHFLLEPESTLRRGTIALDYSFYHGQSRIRLILTPVFTGSRLAEPESRWFFHTPSPEGLPLRIEPPETRRHSGQRAQAALIWSATAAGKHDLQAGLLYWTPSRPVYRKDVILPEPFSPVQTPELIFKESYFPSWIVTGGVSLELTSTVGISAEAAWFHQRKFDRIPAELLSLDWNNPDPAAIPRILQLVNEENQGFLSGHSSLETVLELRYTGSLFDLGGMWSAQVIVDPHPDVIQESVFHTLAASVRRDFFRQRLTSDLTAVFQPAGEDFWIRSEHAYDIMDDVTVSVGAHFFGGPAPSANYGHASFGSFRKNTLVYAGIRLYF